MGAHMPKVIKSAQAAPQKPRIVSKHLNEKVQATSGATVHHVGPKTFTALQWAPAVILAASALLAWTGVSWIIDQGRYTLAGYELCRQGAMPEPEILCDLAEKECIQNPEVAVIVQIQDNIREANSRLARVCI